MNSVADKIDLLYGIGFLGVNAKGRLRKDLDLGHDHSFYFNEGTAVLRSGGDKRYKDYEFIVHNLR